MSPQKCYIFGAGERTNRPLPPLSDGIVIAADGGFDYLKETGGKADYVLGDFDSILSSDLPADSIRYPREKDDTDMMLAAKLGLGKGCTEFIIYGGLGGRLDHTLANIQLLTNLAHNGAVGTLYASDYALRVLSGQSRQTMSFDPESPENVPGNICSVFSLSDTSINVTIRGFKYTTDHATLTNSFPLGISNEFMGKDATISIEKGTIAVLWYLP